MCVAACFPPSSKACGSCVRCICARQRLEAQTKKQHKQELQAAKRIQACMPCHRSRADLINAAAETNLVIEQKLAGRSLFPAPSPSAPFARQRQIDRPKCRFACDQSRTYSHAVIEFGIHRVTESCSLCFCQDFPTGIHRITESCSL